MADKFNHEEYLKDIVVSTDLERELANNPSKLGYYNSQLAHWSRALERAKTLLENHESQLYIKLKDGSITVEGKLTDKYIEAYTQLDEGTQKLIEQASIVREQVKLFEGAVNTLNSKQFSLGSLNSRSKMEQDAITSSGGARVSAEERIALRSRIVDAQD